MVKRTVRGRISARYGRVDCAVSWCEEPAQKLGSLCEQHDCVNERTGHPEGRTVRASELKAFRRTARKYLRKNRDHPAIKAGLNWLTELVYSRRQLSRGELHPNATPKERLDRWMHHFSSKSVDPLDMLAVITGMYFMRLYDRGAFKGDRHFRHQLVIRLLRLAPPPRVPKASVNDHGWRYNRITVGVREYLGRRIETTGVGVLALRIATILVKHVALRDNSADLLREGMKTPFPGVVPSTTNTRRALAILNSAGC